MPTTTTKRFGTTAPATIKADWIENITNVSDTGVVTVSLPSGLPDNRPVTLYAVFCPAAGVPAGFSADSLISNFPSASAPVPADSTDGTPVVVSISVPGVPPGSYTALIIGEYAL